jgi:hypothetical protein
MSLEEATTAFVQIARESVLASPLEMPEVVNSGNGIRGSHGLIFKVDRTLRDAQTIMIEAALKRLGPLAGAEKQTLDAAFEVSAKHLVSDTAFDVKACAREVVNAIVEAGQVAHIITAANYLLYFDDGVERIDIGPVSALPSQVQWDSRDIPGDFTKLQVDGKSGMSLEGDGMTFHMPHLCWMVSLRAARQNVADEALWLIDTAVSLIRVLHSPWRNALQPNAIDGEPHPWMAFPDADPFMIDSAQTYSFGSMSTARHYTIDQTVVSTSESPMFKATAEAIFGSKVKSLAERVAQGLGWMTRARRARSRAESFLFYFTAIEALLTDDDKSSPVTQTVSRHLAVIVSDDPGDRFRLAKKIAALYATRSKLVHSGMRRVGQLDVTYLEKLTEHLYRNVINSCDLNVDRSEFFAPLREASFGSIWSPKTAPIS